jgi:protein tyrosine phosphatase (PTP) superfamily phosphohydrolase (DUF442 family)
METIYQEMYNFIAVGEDLALAGQPNAAQLESLARAGFRTVINLATLNPRYALPDEVGLVRGLGMAYYHIPVEWGSPQASDFAAFEQVMLCLPPGKLLIHCAANYRATAFYALYALKHLGWSEAQAKALRARIWAGSQEPVWEAFIAARLEEIRQARPPAAGPA